MHTSIRTPRRACEHHRAHPNTDARPRTRSRTRSRTRPRSRRASHARRAPRHGRLLLECLIATVLLDATALVVASLAVGVIASAQRTRELAQSWGIAAQQFEHAAVESCAEPLTSGTALINGVRSTWGESPIGPLARDRVLALDLPASAARGFGLVTLRARDARWCR